ncbi:TRADD-N-associated membrane domain-containing protein [Microcoleus sp. N9_A1]|uniref:TRADD-N-associated membrane domain-containing protein n=1 Tax=Microcoleus sp. N9_A1 TaxID=3055380 RepID=UPI002FD338D7
MSNKKLHSNQPLRSDDYPEMKRDVIQECLRQAKSCTNVILGLTIVSASISIFGIVQLFSGKVTEGSVATACGLTSNIVSVGLLKFTKETNDRLERLAKEFKDDD